MKETVRVLLLSVFGLVLAGSLPVFSQQTPSGPPEFLTLPITSRTMPTGLVNGHIVFVPTVANEKIANAPPGGAPPGGGHGGGGSPPPPDFGNVGAVEVTSTCFTLNPTSGGNVDATCAQDSYQGEPMLVNNSGGTLSSGGLFGAENDIYPGNCSASAPDGTFGDCGLSTTFSSSGLADTWQRFKISRNWGGHNYLIDFDPSVAVDSQGRTFVAFGFADSSGPSGMGVVRAPITGDANYLKTNPVSLNGGSTFDDKMWITADHFTSVLTDSRTDRLYIAWDRNKSNNQILEVSHSSDQGQTWSPPVKINDGTTKFERVIYAFPAVAPNHTVYVLWLDYAKNAIYIDKSSDGGNTWGTDVKVADTHIGFGSDIGCNGGRSMAPAPQMAIDSGGNIYVTFADQLAGPGHDFDVFATKSINGAATWSAPVQVSSTAQGHQYNPAIAIDSGGLVRISYLDRREDEINNSSNCRTNTFLSTSTGIGALTFSDSQVTDEDSSFDGNPNGPGDYSGLAAVKVGTSISAHPYFSDHRDANTANDSNSTTIDGGFEVYTATKP